MKNNSKQGKALRILAPLFAIVVIVGAIFFYKHNTTLQQSVSQVLSRINLDENLARALPFGTRCFSAPFFMCVDYAYEYCQYNTPSTCYILGMRDTTSSVPGHAINVTFNLNQKDGKTQYFVTEPQDVTEPIIASWLQKPGTIPVFSDAVKASLIKKYPAVFTSGFVKNFTSVLIPGTHDALTYKKILNTISPGNAANYWSVGWHNLYDLNKLTKALTASSFSVARLPTCSSLEGKQCNVGPRISLTSNSVPLQYAATACRRDFAKDLPDTSACINGKMYQTNYDVHHWKPEPKINLDLSNFCPLSNNLSSKFVTLTVTSSSLTGLENAPGQKDSFKYRVEFYLIDRFNTERLMHIVEGPSLPLSQVTDFSKYDLTPNSYSTYKVYAKVYILTSQNGLSPSFILTYKSTDKIINVGKGGCTVGYTTSHENCLPGGASPNIPFGLEVAEDINIPNHLTCYMKSITITNSSILSFYGLAIQPGWNNFSTNNKDAYANQYFKTGINTLTKDSVRGNPNIFRITVPK